MQRTMQAAVARRFGRPLVIEDVPRPAPGPGQILVSVVASGICDTDLHAVAGDWPIRPTLPFIPGHEGAGYVAAVGAGVTAVKEGDRVGVPWLHGACAACEQCVTGWETLCPSRQNTGYSVNGCFAEYVVANAAFVARIPATLGFADATPILCAGVTSYKGLKETEVRPGQWVVISGIGGLGHLAIQYARAMGIHVVAVDVDRDKLALARSFGAEITVDARTSDPGPEVQRLLGGAHGAIVTAVSPAACRQALGTLRSRGTCVLLGLPPGELPTPIFEVVLKRLTLRGSMGGTRRDLQEALEIAADGAVQPIIELQPLSAINDASARMKEGKLHGRIVLAIRDP